MKISTGQELLQAFINEAEKDNDPYYLAHFSREEDKYSGYHEGLDKMDALILIKQLMGHHGLTILDIKMTESYPLK